MENEFVRWEELDLESVLGEWTDDDELLGPDSEWDTDTGDFGEEDELPCNESAEPPKENIQKPAPKPKKSKTDDEKKIFVCPECSKKYLSVAGFRGHVIKKHNRPDLKGKS